MTHKEEKEIPVIYSQQFLESTQTSSSLSEKNYSPFKMNLSPGVTEALKLHIVLGNKITKHGSHLAEQCISFPLTLP